jgi:hypothetical protein
MEVAAKMTPKSAKRVKAFRIDKKPTSSPEVRLNSSDDITMASPNLTPHNAIQSESRKRRKKQHNNIDTPTLISKAVARDLSELGDKTASVPDDTTATGKIGRESEQSELEDVAVKAEIVTSNLELVRMLQNSKILRSRFAI